MTFNEATDELLAGGVTLSDIANALGASYAAVKQARLAPANPSYRKPPERWAPLLAKLAYDRGRSLKNLADRLSRLNDEGGG